MSVVILFSKDKSVNTFVKGGKCLSAIALTDLIVYFPEIVSSHWKSCSKILLSQTKEWGVCFILFLGLSIMG